MIKQRHFEPLNHTILFKLIFTCSIVVIIMMSVSRDSYAGAFIPNNSVAFSDQSTSVDIQNRSIQKFDIKDNKFQVNKINETAKNNGVLEADLTDETIIPLNAISPDTLKTFVKVIDIARRNYIEPVNDEQLFANAMQGMLKNLDPHAEFLDSQSYENLQVFNQGDIAQVGITVVFNQKLKYWMVEAIAKESSADYAGIEVGFYLHQIDGIKLNQRSNTKDVEQLLQGMAGSVVEIVTSDKGRRKQKHALQRNLMTEKAVNVVVKSGIAIVSIPAFQDNTKSRILEGLVELQEPIMGIVLDLRDNPGGLLDSAVEISSLFQSDVGVVKIEDRDGKQTLLTTQGNSHLKQAPIIILQNRYSASAAEVLASSLQYTGRAKVVGEVSYGKGTIQSVIPISDNQAIKLTIAKYLQADGKQINGIGIIPNIELEGDDVIKSSVGNTDNTTTSPQCKHLNFRVNNMIYTKKGKGTLKENEATINSELDSCSMTPEGLGSNDAQKDWQTQAVDILLNDINASAKKEGKIPKGMKITYPTLE